jgi:hypothetical protein
MQIHVLYIFSPPSSPPSPLDSPLPLSLCESAGARGAGRVARTHLRASGHICRRLCIQAVCACLCAHVFVGWCARAQVSIRHPTNRAAHLTIVSSYRDMEKLRSLSPALARLEPFNPRKIIDLQIVALDAWRRASGRCVFVCVCAYVRVRTLDACVGLRAGLCVWFVCHALTRRASRPVRRSCRSRARARTRSLARALSPPPTAHRPPLSPSFPPSLSRASTHRQTHGVVGGGVGGAGHVRASFAPGSVPCILIMHAQFLTREHTGRKACHRSRNCASVSSRFRSTNRSRFAARCLNSV